MRVGRQNICFQRRECASEETLLSLFNHLTKKHLPLLKHMKDVAMKLLMDKPAEENDKISVKVIDTD
jgi:uncharacterized membrane-anchored protein YhcB (DUF1043 family)